MKSYIQGLITGGVLVFALFVLMGKAPAPYYSIDEVYSKLSDVENVVNDIESSMFTGGSVHAYNCD